MIVRYLSDEGSGRMSDFGTFNVQQVIMHGIPGGSRVPNASDPGFSDAVMSMTNQDKGYITMKLRASLGNGARPVTEDVSLESTTPNIIRGLVNGTGNFATDSQTLARLLHSAQKWMSSPGLVMVVLGDVDSEVCLVVAKMEHQEGMRVEPTRTSTGQKTYKAQHLRDLILAEGTKVFKVGLFPASGAKVGGLLLGSVADDQLSGQVVAGYFVNYLGCVFVRRADVLTKLYFDEAQKIIARECKDDPSQRADCEMALLVDMQGATKRIVPSAFAATHLPEHVQDLFLNKMRDLGFPSGGFPKDVALIETGIKRMRMQTLRGATVIVPPSMHRDGSLKVGPAKGGASRITIVDKILDMRGGGGPKSKESGSKSKEDGLE